MKQSVITLSLLVASASAMVAGTALADTNCGAQCVNDAKVVEVQVDKDIMANPKTKLEKAIVVFRAKMKEKENRN